MAINIDQLLGRAYTLDQVEKHRADSVKLIRDACATEPNIRPFLEEKLRHYRAVHEASFDHAAQRSRDHVGSVLKELLEAALQ